MAKNVWAIAQGRLQKCGVVVQSFYHLVRQLEEKLIGKEMETWATVAWSFGTLGIGFALRKNSPNQMKLFRVLQLLYRTTSDGTGTWLNHD